MELITRKVIAKLEGEDPTCEVLAQYADPDSDKYKAMVEMIRKELHFCKDLLLNFRHFFKLKFIRKNILGLMTGKIVHLLCN